MPAAANRRVGAHAWLLLAITIVTGWSTGALAQNAPGNLPWGMPPDGAPQVSAPSENKGRNFLSPATDFLTGELFRHAYGSAWFGFDSASSGSDHFNTVDAGFGLTSNGFLLDPRLWSQTLSFNLDHLKAGEGATQGLGWFLNGTLLRKRSFPLRLTVTRRAADGTSPDFQNHNSFHMTSLDWTLRKPKLAIIDITATFSGTEQDQSTNALPAFGNTRESERNLEAHISRNFWGWEVTGAGFDFHSRGTSAFLNNSSLFDSTSVGGNIGVQRFLHLGERAELRTSVFHEQRHVTGFNDGSNNAFSPLGGVLSYTNARSDLQYRHTDKFRGFYGAEYTSNISQQAIATGLTALSPGQLNPGLLQALSSPVEISSISTHAKWNYRMSRDLSLGWGVGHTILDIPQPSANSQAVLLSAQPLTAYTNLDGNIAYTRQIGKWEANWHANLTRLWDEVRQGSGWVDDMRTVGVGVARDVDRWRWNSEFSFSEYLPGRPGATSHMEERWSNKLQTRFSNRLLLNLNADVVHTDLNLSSPSTILLPLQGQKSANTLLLMRASLSSRRWELSGGTGLRYLDSRNLAEISNPLLLPGTSSTDHFANLAATFKMRPTLTLSGQYQRDSLMVSSGESTSFSGMQFNVAYRLGKLTLEGGYERQSQDLSGHVSDRNLFFARVRRPFRLY